MPPSLSRALAGSFLVLASAGANAADSCAFLPDTAVATAFADPAARLASADPAGVCAWTLSNGANLIANVYRRKSAAEARQTFDGFKDATAPTATRGAQTPAIGQKAFFGMTPAGTPMGSATLITLQDANVLMLTYMPAFAQGKDVEDTVAGPMLALGRQANGNSAKADQSFGKCRWFTDVEARKLLGKGALTIQRNGENSCVASIAGTRYFLSFDATPRERDPKQGYLKPGEGLCPAVLLPQFGEEGAAEYKCPAPINGNMTIKFRKKGIDAEFHYAPPGRDPGDADVQALLPIVTRAYNAF